MKYFDMFAGLGGFRSGLSKIEGFECTGFCEIDKYAQLAYRTLYNTEKEYFCDDARKIEPDTVPDFDMLCAGFPCQPFSLAGKRLGFDDTRGTLFHEIARLVGAKRPAFLLLENVPGLLSHDEGRTYQTILTTFHELGYSLEWCVLDSKNFGVAQQRKRLYLVGYLDKRCTGQIFPLKGSDAENSGKYTPKVKQMIGGCQGQRVYQTDGAAVTQCSGSGGWGGKTGLYFIDMNADPKITETARCITERQDSGVTKRKGEHSGVLIEKEDGACALLTPDKEKVRQNGRRMKEPDEPMFTITTQDRHGIYHKGRIRRLMPIECFRLQGYTDAQFNRLVEAGVPDTQLYKMAGNSVTVSVVTAVGQKIKSVAEQLNLDNMEDINECI